MIRTLPRINLANLPTPIEFLPRLSALLKGPKIYIKRDDLTGLAEGGNKVRKLEYLVADAKALNADTLITLGGPQSNHCRQTAAAAARCGLRCILVLRGQAPETVNGNLLLDLLLGAEIVWSGARTREEVMEEVVESERRAGRKPYPIPVGGSNALGSSGYVAAIEEAMGQWIKGSDLAQSKLTRIIFASSSGGTHAGLAVGAALTEFDGEVLGISIDEDSDSLCESVAEIATETAELLGLDRAFLAEDIHANADYLGEGYGVMGEREREAIELFAWHEGILLDPVYTGRAAAGMIDLIRRGEIEKNGAVLFWHTGGTPALFAYSEQLLS